MKNRTLLKPIARMAAHSMLELGAWAVMVAAILGIALIPAERSGWLTAAASRSPVALGIYAVVVLLACLQSHGMAVALVSPFERKGEHDA